MSDWSRAASVVKPKRLDGWVVCRAADGLPFLLDEGLEVYFIPPTLRGPRTARVAEIRQIHPDTWEVRFEGIESIEDAEQIQGCWCLVATKAVDMNMPATATQRMMGYTIIEATAGEVGTIVDIQSGPAQDLLVVHTPTGEEVLIPAVDAFLGPLDEEAHTIHATLPPGLLELGQALEGDEQ